MKTWEITYARVITEHARMIIAVPSDWTAAQARAHAPRDVVSTT